MCPAFGRDNGNNLIQNGNVRIERERKVDPERGNQQGSKEWVREEINGKTARSNSCPIMHERKEGLAKVLGTSIGNFILFMENIKRHLCLKRDFIVLRLQFNLWQNDACIKIYDRFISPLKF